ncbi:MAG: hypothetical protein CEE38_12930 [Planctomycetes bacterium B3_Pla]|nr:MAG: hypothetical protein CEE38_12930 [Planctomycetes bacterium B3_Pla]
MIAATGRLSAFCPPTIFARKSWFFRIVFNVRWPKTVSPAIKKTYKVPKKAITNQLTKNLKKLPGISFKTCLPDWLKLSLFGMIFRNTSQPRSKH